MKLKLKEDPKEWLKFTAVMACVAAAVVFILLHRGLIDRRFAMLIWIGLATALVICSFRPRWFRWFYRLGMTASFHVGQVIGAVLLTLFFLLLITPMGLLLRLTGKDLLATKRRNVPTYWNKPKPPGPLDRQF